MNPWGRELYGDPCRECGFDWDTSTDDGVALLAGVPASYAALLAEASGDERHPALSWSVTAYVCHVADNLSIWAERLIGSSRAGRVAIAGYDEHRLAEARGYESIDLAAAAWSLGRAVEAWQEAVAEHRDRSEGVVLVHPERGPLALDDVVVANAHDALHHRWDIERSVVHVDQVQGRAARSAQ